MLSGKAMSKLIIPPPNVIARMINTPNHDINRWKGNCYYVASQIVNEDVLMTDCRAIYGHYLGPISSKSYFRNRKGMPFCQHGWIELANGDIIDPTRWVFEAKEPYMAFIDRDDDIAEEYDEGGDRWRKATENPPPKYNEKDKQFSFTIDDFDRLDGRTYILSLLGYNRNEKKDIKKISLSQIFWLANLSMNTLGVHIREVYNYIEIMKQEAFIPIDNYSKICLVKK
jgi:hypothetical protein